MILIVNAGVLLRVNEFQTPGGARVSESLCPLAMEIH